MTGQPLIFRPKKWQGVAVFGGIGIVVLVIYPFVRNVFEDAEVLLLTAGILFLAAFIALMVDMNKAEIYPDRIVVYFPLQGQRIIYPSDIEKIYIRRNEDLEYGNTTEVVFILNKKLDVWFYKQKFYLRQDPDNRRFKEIMEWLKNRYGDILAEQPN